MDSFEDRIRQAKKSPYIEFLIAILFMLYNTFLHIKVSLYLFIYLFLKKKD